MGKLIYFFYIISITVVILLQQAEAQSYRYYGICDASSSLQGEGDSFFIFEDERNKGYIYNYYYQDSPLEVFDLPVGDLEHEAESDFEASSRLGERIVILGSHGRNDDGEFLMSRQVILGYELKSGRIYEFRGLLEEVLNDSRYLDIGFYEAIQPEVRKDKDLSPKKNGINIEGATFAANGREFFVGLRNHLHNGKAILINVSNIWNVLSRGDRIEFGEPILIDLGGLGVRSIEYIPALGSYVLVAGPVSGHDGSKVLLSSDLKSFRELNTEDLFNPEGIHYNEETESLYIINDNGPLKIDGTKCKKLKDRSKKFFTMTKILI